MAHVPVDSTTTRWGVPQPSEAPFGAASSRVGGDAAGSAPDVGTAGTDATDADLVDRGSHANLLLRTDQLVFSVRSRNCLANEGIRYVFQLVGRTERELLNVRNLGRKSLNEIQEVVEELGLHLGWRLPIDPSEYPMVEAAWDALARALAESHSDLAADAERRANQEQLLQTRGTSNLLLRMDELELSVRSGNCLAGARIEYLFQLVELTESELLRIRNFGRKSLDEICEIVEELGLHLGIRLPIDTSVYEEPGAAREVLARLLTEKVSTGFDGPVGEGAFSGAHAAVLDEPLALRIQLTTRTRRLLREAGLLTVRQLAEATDADLLALAGFDTASVQEVRKGISEFEGRFGSLTYPLLFGRLERAGLANVAASSLGPTFRSAIRSIEAKWGTQTLGSMTRLYPALHAASGNQGTQIRNILGAIRDLLDKGPEVAPRCLGDLLQLAARAIRPRDWETIKLRYLEGATLSQVGDLIGVSRERVRQIVLESLVRLRVHLGPYAEALVGPTVADLERSGGLLHVSELHEILDGAGPNELVFALDVAGHEGFTNWKGAFVARDDLEPAVMARDLAAAVRDAGRAALSPQEIEDLGRARLVHPMSRTTLLRLAEQGMGIPVDDATGVDLGARFGTRHQLVAILNRHAAPMHVADLALAVDASLDRDALMAMAPRARNAILHRVMSPVDRSPDVYRVGTGTFCHRDALPIPVERLEGAVEWSVRWMAGRKGAVSTRVLLREMTAVGEAPDGLNEHLLKDAMKRHADVVTLRKLLVGHAASFQEHGLDMKGRVLDVLFRAQRVLGLDDVREALHRQGTDYSVHSINPFLCCSSLVLNLGSNRFLHPDRLGLSHFERRRLVDEAVALLPEGGQPTSTRILCETLGVASRLGDLAAPADHAAVLWGLLRWDERAVADTGGLVALVMGKAGDSLVDNLLLARLRTLGAATRAEIAHDMESNAGCVLHVNTVNNALARLLPRGLVRPLFADLYAVADLPRDEILLALAARRVRVLRAARSDDLSSWSWRSLDLMANFLHRERRYGDARRFLDALVIRADLPQVDALRVVRLHKIVRLLEDEE